MTDKERIKARMAGAIAALEGKKLGANTYDEGSEEHWQWLAGWTSARTERMKQDVALPKNHSACKCGRAIMEGELARGRCYCGAEIETNATMNDDTLPCVGCGQPVSHHEATVDRDGWWHPACEKQAWDQSEQGAKPIPAPFKAAWQAAKANRKPLIEIS